jgi:hypothetical protein
VNDAEAQEVLSRELSTYREWTHDRLSELIGMEKMVSRVLGPSGVLYYVDIYAVWDSRRTRTVRVLGAIDDGRGLSTYMPLSDSFIKAPDGSFVGEG